MEALEQILNQARQRLRSIVSQPEGLIEVLLKAHLVLEESLDRVIDAGFFHAKHVHSIQLRFAHKVRIAQALCRWLPADRTWTLLLALNELRNHLAHVLEAPKKDVKLAAVREHTIAIFSRTQNPKDIGASPDVIVILEGAAHCQEVLAALEWECRRRREYSEAFEAQVTSDLLAQCSVMDEP